MNAILNYAYAILKAETSLAIVAMGLDPGMGLLHVDNDRRDSLACDLVEIVRPEVAAFYFDWVSRTPFSRDWFFRSGTATVGSMGEFAVTLSETAPRWRQAIAPWSNGSRGRFGKDSPKMAGYRAPANRLTQSRKRIAQRGAPTAPSQALTVLQNLCRTCGAPIMHKGIYCRICNAEASKEIFAKACDIGRKASLSGKAQAK